MNIDLTGKTEYLLKTDSDLDFVIVAENKRYSESQNSHIEVLKPGNYSRKVIELPKIEFKVPIPQFNRFPSNQLLNKYYKRDNVARRFNKIMDKMNIFKILSKNQPIK